MAKNKSVHTISHRETAILTRDSSGEARTIPTGLFWCPKRDRALRVNIDGTST